MKYLVRIGVFLWVLVFSVTLQAQSRGVENEQDSLEVGFLTCAPGPEVYELYGHTALRIRNVKSGEDWVFNYGIFNFRTPHFAWRFMLGQTDYTLGVVPFESFAASYYREGRSVEEQELNLLPQEKNALWSSLVETAMTPDWTYRYNFLYDNCTTRAVDEVEKCLQGQIVWHDSPENDGRTFRDIIHEFSEHTCPWNAFGQDLILGMETDRPIGLRQKMFSPVYAQRYFSKAQVKGINGRLRPLVLRTTRVVEAQAQATNVYPVSPLVAVLALLLVTIIISATERRRMKIMKWIDYLWMVLWGGTGCIVFILFFFSEHPAVGSNWLVVLLNPLPLLALPFKIWIDRRHKYDYYPMAAALAALLAGVMGIFMPQQVPGLFYIILMTLFIRCLHLMVMQRKLAI